MKRLVQIISVVISSVFLFATVGCNSDLPNLVGTYSIQQNGKLTEFVRIERNGDKYFISSKNGRRWLSPVEVASVDEDDLERILSQPVSANINALGNRTMAVVQGRKGWKLGAFESRTGFWLASTEGPIELYKDGVQDAQQAHAGTPWDLHSPNSAQ